MLQGFFEEEMEGSVSHFYERHKTEAIKDIGQIDY
jgi:hypothetical protein